MSHQVFGVNNERVLLDLDNLSQGDRIENSFYTTPVVKEPIIAFAAGNTSILVAFVQPPPGIEICS
jgi:hypothetical protein